MISQLEFIKRSKDPVWFLAFVIGFHCIKRAQTTIKKDRNNSMYIGVSLSLVSSRICFLKRKNNSRKNTIAQRKCIGGEDDGTKK
ncbi:MAG: hypothetical protein ACJASQ_001647 [Crocinitomicaceae bacterium]|jgi:hypothetical protein